MFTQYYLTLGKPKYDDDAIVCFLNSWDKYKGMFFIPTNFFYFFLNQSFYPAKILEWRIFEWQINPSW